MRTTSVSPLKLKENSSSTNPSDPGRVGFVVVV